MHSPRVTPFGENQDQQSKLSRLMNTQPKDRRHLAPVQEEQGFFNSLQHYFRNAPQQKAEQTGVGQEDVLTEEEQEGSSPEIKQTDLVLRGEIQSGQSEDAEDDDIAQEMIEETKDSFEGTGLMRSISTDPFMLKKQVPLT